MILQKKYIWHTKSYKFHNLAHTEATLIAKNIQAMKKLYILIFILLFSNFQSFTQKLYPLKFDTVSVDTAICDFVFPNPQSDADLQELAKKYDLEKLIAEAKTDIEKSLILVDWTSSRWKHNGINKPQKSDALSILAEVDEGKSFRCVEYGIVLVASLNAIGITARTLGLKLKNVETSKYDAGHVASEAYIPELKKWVFMDGQINYIPFLNGIPLNAVEYQNAIIHHRDKIELRNINGTLNQKKTNKQIKWVSKYLFYFDVNFDSSKSKEKCKEKRNLMLVPLGETNPTIFQIDYKINYCIYTNNLKDFYKAPLIP